MKNPRLRVVSALLAVLMLLGGMMEWTLPGFAYAEEAAAQPYLGLAVEDDQAPLPAESTGNESEEAPGTEAETSETLFPEAAPETALPAEDPAAEDALPPVPAPEPAAEASASTPEQW